MKKLTLKDRKPIPKRSKFGNRSCRCNQGHIHLSRGEGGYCNELELRRRSGEFHSYDVEKNYKLEINGKLICNHKPDFTIYKTKSKKEWWIEEYKGFPTDGWKMKMKIFKALYPNNEYIVIKHR